MGDRLKYQASIATLILASCSILWILYLTLWPFRVIEFVHNPLPVVNNVVKPGEILQVRFEFTKYTDVACRVGMALVNEMVYLLPDTMVPRAKGSYKFTSITTKIPLEMPPGDYVLRYSFTYEINPLRTITVMIDTERFSVLGTGYWWDEDWWGDQEEPKDGKRKK